MLNADPELLTTGQAAKYCGVTADAVLKWIKRGRIPARRTAGGHFRVLRKDLDAFLCSAAHRAAGQHDGPRRSMFLASRCWEYFCRDVSPPDACRNCVVYRARIERCYEVAELGETIGHNRRFCRASCQECSFYRAANGLAATVLVVTGDPALVEQLESTADPARLVLRFARSGYECSMLVENLRPALIVIDSSLPEARQSGLVEAIAEDERLPGVRIAVAQRRGSVLATGANVSVIRPPFTAEKILQLVPAATDMVHQTQQAGAE